jgi:hypothetical protein
MYCGLLDVVHGDSWKHVATPVRSGSERSDLLRGVPPLSIVMFICLRLFFLFAFLLYGSLSFWTCGEW